MTIFNSHIRNLRIVLKPATPVYEGGLKVGDKPGQYAQFVEGKFETDDETVITKLEGLSTFGVDFWKASGTEAENEPSKVDDDLQKLTKKELQAKATEKGIALDGSETKDRLIELIDGKQE